MGKAEYWHKAGRRIPFIICVALTAVLLFSAVGYATSYQATTNVTGNTIDTDFFTVGLYKYTGSEEPPSEATFSSSDFQPVDPTTVQHSEITYIEDDETGKMIINGSYDLIPSSLYIVIFDDSVDGASYTPNIDVTMREENKTVDVDPSKYSSFITLGNGANEISEGRAYRVLVTVMFFPGDPYELTGDPFPAYMETTFTIGSVKVDAGNSGAYTYEMDIPLRFESVSSLDGVTVYGDYTLEESTSMIGGQSHEAVEFIGSNGRLADNDGDVDVVFSVESGKRFIVQFTKGAATSENLRLTFLLSYTDEQMQVKSYSKEFHLNKSSTGTFFLSIDSVDDKLEIMVSSELANQDNWIHSGGGDVSLHIYDQNGDVPSQAWMRVVFW